MKFSSNTGGQGAKFVKLESGQSIVGVFAGEVFEFWQHWKNNKPVICTGVDCRLCQENEKSVFRFSLNFITKENGAYTAKIFEGGRTVSDILKDLHEGEYDLEKHIVKITRNGSGKETSYTILPVKNGAITPEQAKNIIQVPLIDLKPKISKDIDRDDVPNFDADYDAEMKF